ncbi:tol-like protein [Apiospora sp. TS-2023a]
MWLSDTSPPELKKITPEHRKPRAGGVHYFDCDEYFADSGERESVSDEDLSTSTRQHLLEKIREEGSIDWLVRSDIEDSQLDNPQEQSEQEQSEQDKSDQDQLAQPQDIEEKYTTIRSLISEASLMNVEDQYYVPCDKIMDIVTKERVRSVLASLRAGKEPPEGDTYHDDLEEFIFAEPGARRLFLILGMTKLLHHLPNLQRHGFDDSALPVRIPESLKGGPKAYSLPDRTKYYDFFREWDINDCTLLCSTQWEFLAPKFGGEKFQFEFQAEHRMPYLEQLYMPADDGFFGEVIFTKIHKSHLADTQWSEVNDGDSINIAIKRAKGHEELAGFFDREATNLEKLRNYKSPHLIKPIAAYKHGSERCLMFPWADGSNIWKYWETHDGSKEVTWLIGQFVGLCSALEELHINEESCVHGDLKPENILIFHRKGAKPIFQIADMGLYAFHEEANKNMTVASGIDSGTSRYKPPEHDPHSSRSRSYDIWSMGCILLELLVWFTSGHGALQAFKRQTPLFWSQKSGSYTIHRDVEIYIKMAEKTLDTESPFMRILRLVRKHVLVEKHNRYNATQLHDELNEIHRSCQTSPSPLLYQVHRMFAYPDTSVESPSK